MSAAIPPETAGLDPESTALLAAADEQYRAGSWLSARLLYTRVQAAQPAAAAALALPLTIGHCDIELASRGAVDQLAVAIAPPSYSVREARFAGEAQTRALELCHGGQFARAARLMRLVAAYHWPTAETYANFILRGRTDCADLIDRPPPEAPLPFLADEAISDDEVARLKRDHAGAKVLLVCRRFSQPPMRQYEGVDNLARSARRFGLIAEEYNSHYLEPGMTAETFPAQLRARIGAARPHVLLFDDLFETGASAAGVTVPAQVAEVLAEARRELGVRVVKSFPDAWWVEARGRERVFLGLGDAVDLVHHCHPTILGHGTPAQNRGVFCYLFPTCLPPPSIPYGTIPGAAFIGGIGPASPARLVVWAELGRGGLPIEFRIGTPPWVPSGPVAQPDDADYAALLRSHQLIVNVTRRTNGVPILVGRTIETMLCGGVLLEEDSVDTAHFFQRGHHYQPFASLADLEELVPRLLDDSGRRARMSEAGQQWAARYFSGDRFWAGMLRRLFG